MNTEWNQGNCCDQEDRGQVVRHRRYLPACRMPRVGALGTSLFSQTGPATGTADLLEEQLQHARFSRNIFAYCRNSGVSLRLYAGPAALSSKTHEVKFVQAKCTSMAQTKVCVSFRPGELGWGPWVSGELETASSWGADSLLGKRISGAYCAHYCTVTDK